MRTPHTHAPRGKRIRVKLRSGEVFVAKFREHTGKYVEFEGRRVLFGDVVQFSIVHRRHEQLQEEGYATKEN